MGYTQYSWDNIYDKAKQPASENTDWDDLTADEKSAAVGLGYIKRTWDNESGKETQPASENKYWAELATCGSCDSTLCTDNSLA